jgi:hypothetical protein
VVPRHETRRGERKLAFQQTHFHLHGRGAPPPEHGFLRLQSEQAPAPTLAISSIPDSVVARLKEAGADRKAPLHLDAQAVVIPAQRVEKPVPSSVRIDVSQFSRSNMKLTTRQ